MFWISLIFMTAEILLGLFCLVLGIRIFRSQRPIFISARHYFMFICLAFLPRLLMPVIDYFFWKDMPAGDLGLPPVFSIMNVLLFLMPLVVLVLFWFQMQGYIVFGISGDSFRTALHDALHRYNIPFEEQLSTLKLTSLDTDLQISAQFWLGTGQIKLKNRRQGQVLEKIVQGLNTYYAENKVAVNKLTAIFDVIFGVLLLILALVTFISLNSYVFFNSYGF